jgi:hypothetical protein
MRPSLAGLLVLIALLAPRSAPAQSLDPRLALPQLEWRRIDADGMLSPAAAVMLPPRGVPVDAIQPGGEVSPVWLFLAGVTGGGLGMVVGAVAGAWLDGGPDEDCIDFCFGPGFVYGALLGESAGVATAVHLANGRKGSYSAGLLTSAGLLALGIGLGHDLPASLLVVPAGQILGTIFVEKATDRRHRRRRW